MTRSATSSLQRVRIATGSAGECRHPAERARPPRRPRRVHGRREDDIRPRYGGQAGPGLPRSRPRDRGTGREDDSRAVRRARRGRVPEDRGARRARRTRSSGAARDLARRWCRDERGDALLASVGVRRADRDRRRLGLGARQALEASAREGRSGVPHALRRAGASLPRRGRRGRGGRRRDRAGRSRRALRARRPRPARRARARQRPGCARDRQQRDGHLRGPRPGGARQPSDDDSRASVGPARRRRGEIDRDRGTALARAPPRPSRHRGRARRRLHDRRRRVRGGDLSPRSPVGRGADHDGRPGRRRDRREDGHRHSRGQEPCRRVPLAGACGDRRVAARDAARAREAAGDGRAREDQASGRAKARRADGRLVQGRDLPAGSPRSRAAPLAEPRAHLRPRARVGRGLRPPARRGSGARAPGGAASLRA